MIYIYSITNLKNNKRYIGITSNAYNRKRVHFWALKNNRHCNEKLQNSYNKYGEDNFIFEIIETIDSDDRMVALERENFYIKKYDSYKNGYNKSLGFDGSVLQKRSNETILKLIKRMKGNKYWLGKKHTKETKDKISLANKNKVVTKVTREKLSKALKGKQIGEKNPFYNKKHTEETKNKIREKVGKKVLCIETGIVYLTSVECSKQLNINRSNICKVCRGTAKSAGGYTFKYV